MTRFRQGRRSVILATTIVAVLTLLVPTASPVAAVPPGIGHDISWPQCGRPFPQGSAFGIVGVNNGKPYTINPCFTAQARWAAATGLPAAFYINTANPGVRSASVNWYAQRSPSPACSRANEAACAYNYGYNGARHAYTYANSVTAAGPGHTWWLDVEIGNSWSTTDRTSNLASIIGALDYLSAQQVMLGAYSTRYQWGRITGGANIPVLPNWLAGARNAGQAAAFCANRSFTGGPVVLVQWVENRLDHDWACPGSDSVLRPPGSQPNLLTDLLRGLGLAPKG